MADIGSNEAFFGGHSGVHGGISAQAAGPRPAFAGPPRGLGGSMAFRMGPRGTAPVGAQGPAFAGGGPGASIFRGTHQAFQPGSMNTSMSTPATMNPALQGGVRPGTNMMGGPSVGSPQAPSLQQIQAEMARRQVGAQLGPRNGALAGYMMG